MVHATNLRAQLTKIGKRPIQGRERFGGLLYLTGINTLDATRHLSGVHTYNPHMPRAT